MNDPANLVLLQTFHEVARTGSVTRAAQNLGRSQPAISHRLRALEADLGVRLFEKVGRKLVLTEYGRLLQTECVDLMARSQHIREVVHRSRTEVEGRVSIGTLPTVASHLLVPVLSELFERHPRIALSFRFGFLTGLVGRLRSGELDVLVTIGDPGLERLDVLPVGEAVLVVVMAPSLAPARARRISPARLRERRYLAFGGQRDPTFDRIDAYARAHALEGPHTPHLPHIEALRELAAAGAGYAIVPAYTVRRDQELGRLVALHPEGLEDTMPVSVVGRRGQVLTPALEAVREAFADLGPHPAKRGRG